MTNNLRVERAILRMTQQQLAEAVGVSRQTINAIETKKYVPSAVEPWATGPTTKVCNTETVCQHAIATIVLRSGRPSS